MNTTGISLFITLRSTFIGRISDTMPIIAHILNILLPTTLPIAISPEPFIADMTLIASSGADVPNATCQTYHEFGNTHAARDGARPVCKHIGAYQYENKTACQEKNIC